MQTYGIIIPGPPLSFEIIQNTGSVSDGKGNLLPVWDPFITVEAGVYYQEKLGAYEERRQGAEVGVSMHHFAFYYDADYIVTLSMRVSYEGTDYDIIKINNPQGVNNHWELKCRDVEAQF